ncbi:SDR family NAD(P)-dependent oxidoreductase [Crossiella sp. CA-258035]|uniref:SDR family NAD(P)-dependent oxidoreductase n=1 Tax=Crossiella sp. CA-258035 TaxID=2981138 RepID=UPI0024BC916A|nr:SDR family NAD(P)-dependent oxidoreductase [Crossiella sp. CA-258035]WHT22019.1 SDR family NAD(P)-dependent oxidoreductase [Crossiella sp. CA-258035]
MRFAHRTVVVTGGAGGLGRAVCAGLAAEGAAVAVLDLAGAEQVAAELTAGGAVAAGFTVDVRERDQVAGAMAAVHRELDGPHVLVALAGGSLGTPRDLADIEPEHLDLVVDVNLKGTFYCCQAALPYLAAAGGGAIVTTSSIGGRQPSPVTGVPYAASKAALVGLTKRLAKEAGPDGVRVNAIAPGLFLTDRLRGMFDDLSQAERDEVLDAIPLRRMPELREAVDPILFLASAQASYITGVVLDVNGGRFMPL